MNTLSENNQTEFYKFLNGDITITELEKFLYHSTDLEQQLDKDTHLELVSIDFNDKYATTRLSDLLKERIIEEGKFETWKLKQVLTALLNDSKNLHIYLDKLYHMYCGLYQEDGRRKYEFKFLANLGLNYLYWVDEGYMKTNYGDEWKQEYYRSFNDFKFYHEQLKPFALEILIALDQAQIRILNDGTYKIENDIKSKLETEKVYKLKHPDKK